MRKRSFKALLAGLMLVGGLFALQATPVEAAENDFTVTYQAEIPLSLDVTNAANPVFKGTGAIYETTLDQYSHQYITISTPDSFVMETPAGNKETPAGTKVELSGSLNARKGFMNRMLGGSDPSMLKKAGIYVEIPITSELLSYGEGQYSVTIPITLSISEAYGSYSADYDFTPWADLVESGDAVVTSGKLTSIKKMDAILEIDPSVTSIGANVFKNTFYYDVEIPSSVTSAQNAFADSNVMMAKFDSGRTAIPASIFKNAKNLMSVQMEQEVNSFGNYCFEGCTALHTVTMPDTVTLGANCFKNCTSLSSFVMTPGITCASISMQTASPFYGSGITNLIISEGVKTVPSYMYCNCPNLSSVSLPYSLQVIGAYSFSDLPKLEEILIRSNISRHSNSVAVGCFVNTGLKKITFEDGITTVPKYMFRDGCANVTELNLADTITTIEGDAFSGCSSLTELELPASITTLGGDAFENATSLKEFHLRKDISLPRSCVVSPFEGSGIEKIIVEEGVTMVCADLFNRGCYNLRDLTIPSTIRTLEGMAFGNATSLKTVTIPANVTLSYGGVVSPFENSGLETIIFSEGVTTINSSLFRSGCSHVTRIDFPSTLTSIGYDAFSGCTSLATVDIPESVTSIGLGAFENSTKLTTLDINSSWSKPSGADMSPFEGSGLTTVYVKNGLTRVGAMHLANNSDDEIVIHIPTSVSSIDGYAFLEGEIYSVVYDGTSSQYNLITKGEEFKPVSVTCSDMVLTSSLMSTDSTEEDLEDLFAGLTDEDGTEVTEP